MYILQEGIIGGVVLMIFCGLAILIGVPVITILLKKPSGSPRSTDQETGKNESTFSPDQKPDKSGPVLFQRIIIAFVLVFILLFIMLKIFDIFFHGYG